MVVRFRQDPAVGSFVTRGGKARNRTPTGTQIIPIISPLYCMCIRHMDRPLSFIKLQLLTVTRCGLLRGSTNYRAFRKSGDKNADEKPIRRIPRTESCTNKTNEPSSPFKNTVTTRGLGRTDNASPAEVSGNDRTKMKPFYRPSLTLSSPISLKRMKSTPPKDCVKTTLLQN